MAHANCPERKAGTIVRDDHFRKWSILVVEEDPEAEGKPGRFHQARVVRMPAGAILRNQALKQALAISNR
jgi:hypothetical protein